MTLEAIKLLHKIDNRGLCQCAGPAIQDLGYRYPSKLFNDSQNEMAEAIRPFIFDVNGLVRGNLVGAMLHASRESQIMEPKYLVITAVRIAAIQHHLSRFC